MYISSDIPLNFNRERAGTKADLKVLLEDDWLRDTEVKYLLEEKNGLWHLSMIYISIHDALKFVCRRIDVYNSEKKAVTYARILQRGIRKDARGTLKTNRDAFNFCDN